MNGLSQESPCHLIGCERHLIFASQMALLRLAGRRHMALLPIKVRCSPDGGGADDVAVSAFARFSMRASSDPRAAPLSQRACISSHTALRKVLFKLLQSNRRTNGCVQRMCLAKRTALQQWWVHGDPSTNTFPGSQGFR